MNLYELIDYQQLILHLLELSRKAKRPQVQIDTICKELMRVDTAIDALYAKKPNSHLSLIM